MHCDIIIHDTNALLKHEQQANRRETDRDRTAKGGSTYLVITCSSSLGVDNFSLLVLIESRNDDILSLSQ